MIAAPARLRAVFFAKNKKHRIFFRKEAHGCAQGDSFEEEADCGWEYLSGYAERLGDGSILVTFGKEAKKYLAREDGNAAPEE